MSLLCVTVMAEGRSGEDIVSEYLDQNPHLVEWVESLRGGHETNKQWHARREFFLRNMETFPTVQPGFPSPSLDRLLSLSICWANHIFLGCRYVYCSLVPDLFVLSCQLDLKQAMFEEWIEELRFLWISMWSVTVI